MDPFRNSNSALLYYRYTVPPLSTELVRRNYSEDVWFFWHEVISHRDQYCERTGLVQTVLYVILYDLSQKLKLSIDQDSRNINHTWALLVLNKTKCTSTGVCYRD